MDRAELDRLIAQWESAYGHNTGATLGVKIQICLLREILRRLDEAVGK